VGGLFFFLGVSRVGLLGGGACVGFIDYAQLWLGVGVRMGVYAQRQFVANFLYLFRYSVALHACCAGSCGRKVARTGFLFGLQTHIFVSILPLVSISWLKQIATISTRK
jgi:hypothetical protein